MDELQEQAEASETFASYVRNGLSSTEVSEIIKTLHPTALAKLLALSDDWVDPAAFLSKIKFDDGFEGDSSSSHRQSWFVSIVSAKENNHLRRSILLAIDENANITPQLKDKSISLSMHQENRGANDLHSRFGGIEMHTCWKQIILPFFKTKDELLAILAGIGSSRTNNSADLYTAL
jgi:hypothetical protein